MSKSIFSQNLIKARKQRNWSQEGCASALGIKQKAYAKYEEDRAEPSQIILIKICEVFSIEDLKSFIEDANYFDQSKAA